MRSASTGSRSTSCATPRTRTTPPRSRWSKLVRRVKQFRGDSQFSTWLHRLVVNTCKDVAQARWAAERRTEPLLEDTPCRAGRRSGARARRCRDATRARRVPGRAARRPGERRRAQGRVRRVVRRDLGGDGAARRNRQVLRAPRAHRAPGEALAHERAVAGQGSDRGCAAASRPDAPDRRGARARAGRACRRAEDRHGRGLRGPLSRQPDHARREDGRGARPVRRGGGALAARERAASSRSSPASTTSASSASCGPATC